MSGASRKPRSDRGRSRVAYGPRVGSQNDWLRTFEVGETRWAERTGIHPPVPPPARRPAETYPWVFEATAFMAVPQTSLTEEPVRLWRVTRLG